MYWSGIHRKNAIVFVAKDKALLPTLRTYASECSSIGANDEHIASIMLLIERVQEYQRDIEVKVPDTIGDCELNRCISGKNLE